MALKTCLRAFRSKWKYEILNVVVRVPQTTQNLVISHSSVLQRKTRKRITIYNAGAQLLFYSLNLLFGDVLVAVVVMVCLNSLSTNSSEVCSSYTSRD